MLVILNRQMHDLTWGPITPSFDICEDTGGAAAFFPSGHTALLGTFTEVDCSEWTGSDGAGEFNGSCIAGESAAFWPGNTACGNQGRSCNVVKLLVLGLGLMISLMKEHLEEALLHLQDSQLHLWAAPLQLPLPLLSLPLPRLQYRHPPGQFQSLTSAAG